MTKIKISQFFTVITMCMSCMDGSCMDGRMADVSSDDEASLRAQFRNLSLSSEGETNVQGWIDLSPELVEDLLEGSESSIFSVENVGGQMPFVQPRSLGVESYTPVEMSTEAELAFKFPTEEYAEKVLKSETFVKNVETTADTFVDLIDPVTSEQTINALERGADCIVEHNSEDEILLYARAIEASLERLENFNRKRVCSKLRERLGKRQEELGKLRECVSERGGVIMRGNWLMNFAKDRHESTINAENVHKWISETQNSIIKLQEKHKCMRDTMQVSRQPSVACSPEERAASFLPKELKKVKPSKNKRKKRH